MTAGQATPTLDPPRILKHRFLWELASYYPGHTYTRSAEDTETSARLKAALRQLRHTYTRSAEDTETSGTDKTRKLTLGHTYTRSAEDTETYKQTQLATNQHFGHTYTRSAEDTETK